MPTNRTYRDGCGIARALDVVGERWALLIVRELLLGPRRYSDLRRALPDASSNLVADRLRELERHGVLARRVLPAPAGSRIYELTPWGRELEPILLALGGWGLRVPLPGTPVTISATSVLLFLRGCVGPNPALPPAVYGIEMPEGVWTVRVNRNAVEVDAGAPAAPNAALRTDPVALNALLQGDTTLDAAVADGIAGVTGDSEAVRRLLATASRSDRAQ